MCIRTRIPSRANMTDPEGVMVGSTVQKTSDSLVAEVAVTARM